MQAVVLGADGVLDGREFRRRGDRPHDYAPSVVRAVGAAVKAGAVHLLVSIERKIDLCGPKGR